MLDFASSNFVKPGMEQELFDRGSKQVDQVEKEDHAKDRYRSRACVPDHTGVQLVSSDEEEHVVDHDDEAELVEVFKLVQKRLLVCESGGKVCKVDCEQDEVGVEQRMLLLLQKEHQ